MVVLVLGMGIKIFLGVFCLYFVRLGESLPLLAVYVVCATIDRHKVRVVFVFSACTSLGQFQASQVQDSHTLITNKAIMFFITSSLICFVLSLLTCEGKLRIENPCTNVYVCFIFVYMEDLFPRFSSSHHTSKKKVIIVIENVTIRKA
jgi:hypothetical protein